MEKTGSIFLAGPYLVKAAIGEEVEQETLGGASTHCEISGVTDYKMPDEKTCLATIRSLISKLGHRQEAGFDRMEPTMPKVENNELYRLFSAYGAKPYDTRELLKCITDNSEWDE